MAVWRAFTPIDRLIPPCPAPELAPRDPGHVSVFRKARGLKQGTKGAGVRPGGAPTRGQPLSKEAKGKLSVISLLSLPL